jgi:protoporphyrinogen oxidase
MKSKTIIIGAGVAGLTIASKLQNNDYIILEARQRIGGRVFTNDKNIDAGAAWVHGVCDNPLTDLLSSDDLIPVAECNPWMHSENANITYYLGGRSSPITPPYNTSLRSEAEEKKCSMGLKGNSEFPLEKRQSLAKKWNDLIQKTNELNGSTTIAEAFSFFSEDDDMRSFLYMIEVWCGGSIQNLPVSFLQQPESALFGDYAGSHCLFKKGAKTLIESLSKDCINKIICNQIVTKIIHDTNEVEVHTREGLIYKCNKLCITIPPGPLRDIEFDPPLPPLKMDALSHIKMGSYKKIQLEFDEVFWNDAPMILTRNEKNEYILWNNYMVSKNMPILEAICPADHGFRLSHKSDEEIVDTVFDHLKLYFKNVPFPKS